MSFVSKVSIGLSDFAIPFFFGAVDGTFRRTSALKSGIQFGVISSVMILAARIFQAFVVNPIAQGYKWKPSMRQAIGTLNTVAFGTAAIVCAVAINAIGKVTAGIVGLFILDTLISGLQFAIELRARGA